MHTNHKHHTPILFEFRLLWTLVRAEKRDDGMEERTCVHVWVNVWGCRVAVGAGVGVGGGVGGSVGVDAGVGMGVGVGGGSSLHVWWV